MEVLLDVQEVAELKNCSERFIRKSISDKKIDAVEVANTKGVKKYQIPLSQLSKSLQRKYRIRLSNVSEVQVNEVENEVQDFENFTEKERQEIVFWKDIIEKWQLYRSEGGKKEVRDEQFIEMYKLLYPDMDLSRRTLFRRYKNWKQYGDVALIEKRGKCNKGKSKIDQVVWAIFEQYYLSEERLDISQCVELIEMWAEQERPELLPLPHYSTFYRHVEDIPYAVQRYFRYGAKDCEDKALPYIQRMYEDIESNDIWVADNHTFDVITRFDDGSETTHRLYCCAYMDIRSRKVVAVHIAESASSDSNLFTLKKGIEKYGIPREIYTDNGREFLVHDIGGRGRRKTHDDGEHQVPTILERLDVKFTNAKVRNGRAKIIERGFREFKNWFSKLIDTYCGGHVLERPDRLKDKVKNINNIMLDSEFKEKFYLFVEGYYNEKGQKGNGMNGLSPNDVFEQNLVVKRTASKNDLNLMLMRSTRIQMVGRMGVKLKLYGQDLYYWNEDLIINHQRKKVYLRYDADIMSTVRVYDEDDKFLCEAVNAEALKYGATKEDIKEASSAIKRVERTVKNYKKDGCIEIYEAKDKMDVMLGRASRNVAKRVDPSAKVVEIVRPDETEYNPQFDQAVGSGVDVDLGRMVNNIRNMKGD